MKINEEDVEAVDPLLSQFLKKNSFDWSRRSMVSYSQLKVLNKEVQDTVPTENLPSDFV